MDMRSQSRIQFSHNHRRSCKKYLIETIGEKQLTKKVTSLLDRSPVDKPGKLARDTLGRAGARCRFDKLNFKVFFYFRFISTTIYQDVYEEKR